jgi:hypothetical protein
MAGAPGISPPGVEVPGLYAYHMVLINRCNLAWLSAHASASKNDAARVQAQYGQRAGRPRAELGGGRLLDHLIRLQQE